jgi:hypothetical protein
MKHLMGSIIIMILSFTSSCAHKDKFISDLSSDKCEDALTHIPENQKVYKIQSISQQAAGSLISYSFTGVAYTVQILWNITAGGVAGIFLCAPDIALNLAQTKNSNMSNPSGPTCFPANIRPILSPSLGKSAYENTENLRCPPLEGLSQSIRKVAQCFAARKTHADYQKAISILKSVSDSGSFYSCLPESEMQSHIEALKTYNDSLNSLPRE